MSAKWIMAAGYLLAVPLSVFAGADKTAVATRTDAPPVIDGHLSDHCWDLAVPTTDFILLDPVEGAPAANQTVVKILYTADQLYIGLFMADSNAENIDARVVPRDGRFAPRDLIGILLDTQHDHRNAYGFYINPYGIQHDFQMTDDGAKGYRGNNKGWDGVWRAEAAVLDSGWSAEVAIAFSTLAFAAGDDMVWGFNLERLSITGRERSHWAAIYQEDGSVLRVSKAGHLVGLQGIDPGLRLELLPYAASGVDRTHADWRGETADAGLDVKYGVAANATLDITVNPDFAQIEADEEEINLSRFPLLLKERRPFFVENADFLGKHGLFYSRRIADPDFGAKFIGKAGEYTLGILTAQDRGEAGARPKFGVLKLQREVFHNSTVGALVEGVRDRGITLQQIAGLDTRVEWDDRYIINAYAARSAEQGSSGYISGADMSYRHGNFAGGVNYRSIESTFSADRLGFIERDRGVASQSVEFSADWRPRMRRLGKLNLGQAVSLEQRSVEDGWGWEWTTADVWLYTWDDSFVSAKHSVWRWPWQGTWYRGQTLEMGFDTGDGRKWKLDIGAGLQERKSSASRWRICCPTERCENGCKGNMGDERDPTDGDLVRRFAEGDMAAFAILVTRYQNGVFLFFCRMTGRRADAEDMAQETFVRVYESLHSLDDPTRFRSWFWAIASNLCRDYHKYHQRRHHLSIERDIDLDLQLAEKGSARTVELASRIRTALAALDDERRLVVVLREYHELSYEEIAATVSCSVGAVRWRLHAARQQLRASLSDLIG